MEKKSFVKDVLNNLEIEYVNQPPFPSAYKLYALATTANAIINPFASMQYICYNLEMMTINFHKDSSIEWKKKNKFY
jgi:hypothetical protein